MNISESIGQALVREVLEEPCSVEPTRIVARDVLCAPS